MKKLIFLLPLLLLVSCAPRRYSGEIYGYFDTIVTLDGYFESEEDFNEAYLLVEDTLSHYHDIFDIHENGELKRLNDERTLEVSNELLDAISFGLEMEELSDGKLNIAFGSVISLWKRSIESGGDYFPTKEELEWANKFTNADGVKIEGYKITLGEGILLDLGAIAKGYVSDILKEKLLEEGFDNMIVNLGGNVVVLGDKDGKGWKVGVKNPLGEGLSDTFSVSDACLVTSGNYQRFFDKDGIRYHHIISTDTLFPSENFLSVSVLSKSGALADALSTALFSMKLEDAFALLEKTDVEKALFIDKNGEKIYYTKI